MCTHFLGIYCIMMVINSMLSRRIVMKRLLAFLVSLIIIFTLAVTVISADNSRKVDMRELEEYGQRHIYLGEPLSRDEAPNYYDATVSDGEYTFSYEYKIGEKSSVWSDKNAKATFADNEWVRVHLAYGAETLYVAIETKDANYVKGKDGVAFNLGFRSGGRPVDAISRMCFDMYMHENAVEGDITTLKTKCRSFIKLDNGAWGDNSSVDGSMYIDGASFIHDDKTDITTVEAAIDITPQIEFWGNEQPLGEIRMYFIPFVYMYGESVKGAGDVISQGILWNYLPSDEISALKSQFAAAYPEATYWSSMVPNIVHFRSESDIPQAAQTTAEITTEITTTIADATTAEVSVDNVADIEKSGCSSSLALTSIACFSLVPLVFVTKRRDEEI